MLHVMLSIHMYVKSKTFIQKVLKNRLTNGKMIFYLPIICFLILVIISYDPIFGLSFIESIPPTLKLMTVCTVNNVYVLFIQRLSSMT